jgi:hypothetical protein
VPADDPLPLPDPEYLLDSEVLPPSSSGHDPLPLPVSIPDDEGGDNTTTTIDPPEATLPAPTAATPQELPDAATVNDDLVVDDTADNDVAVPLRRSQRISTRNPRYFGPQCANLALLPFVMFSALPVQGLLSSTGSSLNSLDLSLPTNDPIHQAYEALLEPTEEPYKNDVIDQHPMAFASKVTSLDEPSLHEILNLQDDVERSAWIQAMYDELDAIQDKGTFTVVDRAAAGDHEIVPSTGAFKRKRFPDGSLMKLKARFCVRGDQQFETGRVKSETYSPVVDWSTLRMLFGLTVQYGLATQQIDFKNAFVQSDLPAPLYLEPPPGPF